MKKLKIILHYKFFYLILIIITILSCIYNTKLKKYSSLYKTSNLEITGKIIDVTKKDGYYSFILKEKQKILCFYYIDDLDIDYGDIVTVIGMPKKLSNTTVMGGFNYKEYLYNNKIYTLMDVSKIIVKNKNNNILYLVKNTLLNRADNSVKANIYIKAMIFGKNQIDSQFRTIYKNIGINHLFSISGIHLSIFCSCLLFILRKLKCDSFVKSIIISLFVFYYMFITNYQPSILRSGTFLIINRINKLLKLDISSFKTLIITICIIVLLNPFIVYNIGFIFSSCISIFLIYYKDLINGSYIEKSIKVSLIVFLCSFPIMIYYFYEVNILSFIYNLFLIPYVSIIILPLCILCLMFPLFKIILLFFINILETICLFFNNINSIIIMGRCSLILIIIYYLVFIFSLNKIKKKKYKYIGLICIMLALFYNYNYFFNRNYILMLDVGQGDSILFNIDNKVILMDTGVKLNKDSNVLNTTLKYYGIKKIDYVILSHGDYDHMGEAINLVENFKVEKVIFNCGEFNDLEQELIKVLDNKKIPY
ncbi:MAG: ComEC/Rec2 family competence protein, partial [bacterium]|nr:ComEC/Rec2 family competence protein [bacterium]